MKFGIYEEHKISRSEMKFGTSLDNSSDRSNINQGKKRTQKPHGMEQKKIYSSKRKFKHFGPYTHCIRYI